jgi:hypothetical protein
LGIVTVALPRKFALELVCLLEALTGNPYLLDRGQDRTARLASMTTVAKATAWGERVDLRKPAAPKLRVIVGESQIHAWPACRAVGPRRVALPPIPARLARRSGPSPAAKSAYECADDVIGASGDRSTSRTLAELAAMSKSADLAGVSRSVTVKCGTRENTNIGGVFAIVHGLLLA